MQKYWFLTYQAPLFPKKVTHIKILIKVIRL